MPNVSVFFPWVGQKPAINNLNSGKTNSRNKKIMSENLKNYWANVTTEFPKSFSDSWWALITEKYSENGRCIFNLFYLEEKFKEFENFKQFIKNPQAFTFALFFQYFEYDPKDPLFHDRNKQIFSKFANEADIKRESELYKETMSLIEASAYHLTEGHKTKGAFGEEDLHYFLDLDMSTLGCSEENYARYLESLRNEYSFLDLKTYKSLRKKILQNFLQIPNIFATKQFREKFEIQARKNMQEELNGLM